MPTPLVSAVMPTFGRPDLAKHSIEMFFRQDWDNKELVIVDDSPYQLQLPLIHDRRVRHLRVYDRQPLALKHDIGLQVAQGEIVCHWDDDDWYSPRRISRQVAALREHSAQLCGLKRDLVLFSDGTWGRIQGPTREPGDWAGNALSAYSRYHFHDGTAMFLRSVIRGTIRYGLQPISAKVLFLNEIVNRGNKYVDLENEGDFVYVRHGDNLWQPDLSKCLKPAEAPPWFPGEELKFFRSVWAK